MEEKNGLNLRFPTQAKRLKWFAISHFAISIIGVIGMFLSLRLGGYMTVVLFWEAVLLALYVFAGGWIARKLSWCPPQSVGEGLKAFLFPALIAWAWGGTFLFVTAVPRVQLGMGDAGDILAIFLMWSLFILAFPSSWGFALLFLACGATESPPVLFLLMIVVGAVPPLLFVLGSVLGARKGKADGMQRED